MASVAVGFFYAVFLFSLGYFGVAALGLVVAVLAGTVVSAVLGYYTARNWAVSVFAQCGGTAPYTLLLLLGGGLSMGDRLVNLFVMIGPAVIGTPIGVGIRRYQRAA
jgi:hypothetical protein